MIHRNGERSDTGFRKYGGWCAEKQDPGCIEEGLRKEQGFSLDSPLFGISWQKKIKVGVEVFVGGSYLDDICISQSVMIDREVRSSRSVVMGCAC